MAKKPTTYAVKVPQHIWLQIDKIKARTGKTKEWITKELLEEGLKKNFTDKSRVY